MEREIGAVAESPCVLQTAKAGSLRASPPPPLPSPSGLHQLPPELLLPSSSPLLHTACGSHLQAFRPESQQN
eukprot:6204184-Pleurochrysis_carterae.AAC.1